MTSSPPIFPARYLTKAGQIILILVACLPYAASIHTPLFFDSLLLLNEPAARDIRVAFRDLWKTSLHPGQELTLLTFAANYRVNNMFNRPGFDPPGFILVNISLHAINACLVFFLVRALLRIRRPDGTTHNLIALIVAGLFAAHPLHATSVLYILQRRGLLVALFHLLALLGYLQMRTGRVARDRILWGAALLFLTWLAMKSKSTGLTLPLSLLALELCLRLPDTRSLRRLLPWAGGMVVLWTVGVLAYLSSISLFDPHHFRFLSPPTALEGVKWTAPQNALTQARAFMDYWGLLLVPRPAWLCIDHEFSPTLTWMEPRAWISVAANVAILALAFVAARRRLLLAAFGVLLFYSSLVPWIFLLQPVLFVEYRTYLCGVGVALIIAEALGSMPWRISRGIAFGVAATFIIILGVMTFERGRLFRDPIALWSDVVAKYPNQFRAHYNLAGGLFKETHYDEALPHYRDAVRLDPLSYQAHFNMGNTLRLLNRPEEAVREFVRVLEINPDHAKARAALEQLGISAQFER